MPCIRVFGALHRPFLQLAGGACVASERMHVSSDLFMCASVCDLRRAGPMCARVGSLPLLVV